MAALTPYEKVASVIGDEMNSAWTNIMRKLASAPDKNLLQADGTKITTDDLGEFFKKLGGAQMQLLFSCVEPKGEIQKFFSDDLLPTVKGGNLAPLGIEGSISIGVGIRF